MIFLKSHVLSICTKGRPKDLDSLFTSLMNQTFMPEKILIVESGSELENKGITKKYLDFFDIETLFIDVSMVKARNLSLDYAKNNNFNFLHFVDDDTELDSEYFFWINEVFQSNLKVAGVGGHVLSNNQKKLSFPRYLFGKLLDGAVTPLGSGYGFYLNSEVMRVSWLAGCSMSFRVSKLQVHKFDETLEKIKSMGEDLHFTYNLSRSEIIFRTPKAKILHNQSPINRSSPSEWLVNTSKSKFRLFSVLNVRFKFLRINLYLFFSCLSSLFRYMFLLNKEARKSAKDYLIILVKKKYFL